MAKSIPDPVQKRFFQAAGLSGGAIPGVGDPLMLAGRWALKRYGYVRQAAWLTTGMAGSVYLGAAVGASEYHKRWDLGRFGQRMLQQVTLGAYDPGPIAWENTPKTSYEAWKTSKSTRGEDTSRTRTPKSRKSIRGESAQRKLDKSIWARGKTRSRASSKKPAGRIPSTDRGGAPSTGKPRRRTPKTLRYRKGGCPPGYRYDPRRKMCVRTY